MREWKRIKAGMNERKNQYSKHAIHCLDLVYHHHFFSPRRCNADARGMYFNIYITAHRNCSLCLVLG